jgi:hypothetical protein
MTKRYQPSKTHPEAPLRILNNPIDTGYQVKTKHKTADQSDTWNASLIANSGEELKLWIEEAKMDFSMSGSTGQSRYRNQFYPKAFNQPSLIVNGTMPNQYEYNRLASFVRETHFDALNQTNRNIGTTKNIKTYNNKTIKLLIKDAGKGKQPKRNQKGGHLAMAFQGYIRNIQAGATKFQFAPRFQFEFVIAASTDTGQVGIYRDDLDAGSAISGWMESFNAYKSTWQAGQPSTPSTGQNNSSPLSNQK